MVVYLMNNFSKQAEEDCTVIQEGLAVKNLKETKEILDKHGIKYCLDCGTSLSAVLAGRMIQCYTEIDLGLMGDDWKTLTSALSEFEERGFHILLVDCKPYNDLNVSERHVKMFRFGMLMDIHAYHVVNESAVTIMADSTNPVSRRLQGIYYLLRPAYYSSRPRVYIRKVLERLSLLPSKLRDLLANMVRFLWVRSGIRLSIVFVPKRHFEKFETIEFHSMTFNLPFDAEGLFRRRYGEDWKVPKKKYWENPYGTVKTFKERLFSNQKKQKRVTCAFHR
jgi:phosphorylcholine metabolism protein LicD